MYIHTRIHIYIHLVVPFNIFDATVSPSWDVPRMPILEPNGVYMDGGPEIWENVQGVVSDGPGASLGSAYYHAEARGIPTREFV